MSFDVGSFILIVGYLVPGMCFGKQMGWDTAQDVGGLFEATAMFSAV